MMMRPATPEDADFLRGLFSDVRGADLVSVEPVQRRTLLAIQWRGRETQYAAAYPRAVDHIIEAEGRPAGRILVDETADDVHVVDIAVAADARGRGLGGAALRAWCDRADESGRTLSLTVAPGNPARRLYERLGLEAVAEDQTAVRMRRQPKEDIRA
ncbi:GNAT family N-acetyltransferase [Nocardioides sp. SR21]|uniref:GNAT family N-acetyltransferase n=1 Tax=Nocardioides sp. SR21 TaxID=2919501 RepID=UPI001FA99029|nr:GNAT family N-acetyltransferase [Nocardioides sp. SR21]